MYNFYIYIKYYLVVPTQKENIERKDDNDDEEASTRVNAFQTIFNQNIFINNYLKFIFLCFCIILIY